MIGDINRTRIELRQTSEAALIEKKRQYEERLARCNEEIKPLDEEMAAYRSRMDAWKKQALDAASAGQAEPEMPPLAPGYLERVKARERLLDEIEDAQCKFGIVTLLLKEGLLQRADAEQQVMAMRPFWYRFSDPFETAWGVISRYNQAQGKDPEGVTGGTDLSGAPRAPRS